MLHLSQQHQHLLLVHKICVFSHTHVIRGLHKKHKSLLAIQVQVMYNVSCWSTLSPDFIGKTWRKRLHPEISTLKMDPFRKKTHKQISFFVRLRIWNKFASFKSYISRPLNQTSVFFQTPLCFSVILFSYTPQTAKTAQLSGQRQWFVGRSCRVGAACGRFRWKVKAAVVVGRCWLGGGIAGRCLGGQAGVSIPLLASLWNFVG